MGDKRPDKIKRAVAKVALLPYQSGTSAIRKWHFRDHKVPLCDTASIAYGLAPIKPITSNLYKAK